MTMLGGVPRPIPVEIGAVRGLRRVFVGNHDVLAAKVSVVSDPGQWLPIVAVDGGQFQPYLDDLDRLLFNYLASAFSLSNSIWGARGRLRKTVTFTGYNERNPYKQSDLSAFVLQLRHVVQHDRVAVSKGTLSFAREAEGAPLTGGPDFVLSREQLRTLDYGNADPPAFVRSLTKDLPLSTLTERFTPELLAFVDWFISELEVAGG